LPFAENHCTAIRFGGNIAVVDDRGFFLTLQAIRRQLAAIPNELYLIRLIHHQSRRAVPGERLWTADQLANPATVRFLRARNADGCDVYVHPYAGRQNAGYILVDLDRAGTTVVESMRAHGHDPCVVVQTSPGHLQAWVQVSTEPVEPAVATAAGKRLARAYGGDPASTDWRHLGRLAGFTNQKPARRTPNGYAPWVKIVHASSGLAPRADALLQSVQAGISTSNQASPASLAASEAVAVYRDCMERWRILERFPQPDWSIVDLWVARHLLSQGMLPVQVQHVVRLASPQFPRRHADADDYLRRTLARAAAFPFPRAPRALCATHAETSTAAPADSVCSNSTGGR
jgi:hypothetical protein